MNESEIRDLVLRAMENINLARTPGSHLQIAPEAVIFGAESPLDSLGLVSLLIDIEESLQDHGHSVTLSDARAMSESRSPFRSVPALVTYIGERIQSASAS